jgi:flagellar basal-body rod protein FlgF
MDASSYVTLSRQTGLQREMQVTANNIANAATTGFRQEGLIFSEFIDSAQGRSSLAMSTARIRNTSMSQGTLTQSNGSFDFAIEGDGFFLVETPAGQRLTRAGSFSPDAEGNLVTMGGSPFWTLAAPQYLYPDQWKTLALPVTEQSAQTASPLVKSDCICRSMPKG